MCQLRVPLIRQPDPVGCLPACVWSVLTFAGYSVTYEQVTEACRMDRRGCVQELALQGLRDAGWDVELLDEIDQDRLRSALDDERPLIISLLPSVPSGIQYAHAVVLCGVTDEEVTVMDPLEGDYVTLSWEAVRQRIGRGVIGSFFIGSALAAGEGS